VALHREVKSRLGAGVVDRHRLQEAGIDDVQRVERLTDRVDALPGLELHVLEQKIIARTLHRDAQQIAHFLQAGPQLGLTLPCVGGHHGLGRDGAEFVVVHGLHGGSPCKRCCGFC